MQIQPIPQHPVHDPNGDRFTATITRSTPRPWMMNLINRAMTYALARGWRPASDDLMLLHWTGRKTGNDYSTPIGRHEHNGQLFAITQASYKHNFVGGAPVVLVIDGVRRPFTATVVSTPEHVGRRMRGLLDDLGTKRGARAMACRIQGDPTVDDLALYAYEQGAVILNFEPRSVDQRVGRSPASMTR